MADEEKNETTEEQPEETSAEDAPAEDAAAAGPVAADDSPGSPEDGESEEPSAAPPAEEASEEEAPAEEAPPAEQGAKEAAEESVEDAPSEEPSAAPPAEEAAEAAEALGPKQKRKLERSQFSGEAAPQRSPEDRAKERIEARRKAKESRRRVRARVRQAKGEPGVGTPPAEREPGQRKIRQGTVVSDKADKTITVEIVLARRHPSYEKIVRRSRKLHAHDESNEARQGDVVRVIETRPLSRTKRWRLAEIVERAPSR